MDCSTLGFRAILNPTRYYFWQILLLFCQIEMCSLFSDCLSLWDAAERLSQLSVDSVRTLWLKYLKTGHRLVMKLVRARNDNNVERDASTTSRERRSTFVFWSWFGSNRVIFTSSSFLQIRLKALKIASVDPVMVTIRSGHDPSEMLMRAPD